MQGDWSKDLIGKYSKSKFTGYGFGPDGATMCGFPHFEKVKFDGKFPIATLTFEDDDFPAKVIMKAFNPFIPLDADNSSIPAAFFEINIKSLADNVKFTIILSVQNPFACSKNQKLQSSKYTAVKLFHNGKKTTDKEYGDITVAVDRNDGIYQEYWYRGRWQDRVTTFWRDLTDGTFANRCYESADKGDMCSVGASDIINNNSNKSFRFVFSWNIPNNYNYWSPCKDENGKDITWKNYYAVMFADSEESCFYSQ